jgi:hypothetical protein
MTIKIELYKAGNLIHTYKWNAEYNVPLPAKGDFVNGERILDRYFVIPPDGNKEIVVELRA